MAACIIPFPRGRVVRDLDPLKQATAAYYFYVAAHTAKSLKCTHAEAERLVRLYGSLGEMHHD